MTKLSRKIVTLAMIPVLFIAVGCCQLNRAYIAEIRNAAEVVSVDFLDYVDNDPRLDDQAKKNRHDAVNELRKAIQDAEDASKE